MPTKKQTKKATKKSPKNAGGKVKASIVVIKEEPKPQKFKTIMILVLIATLIIAALGVLERNKIITIIGGLGFLLIVGKLLIESIMEDIGK